MTKKNKLSMPFLAMVLSSVIAGLVTILNKAVLRDVSVIELTTLRFTFALVLVVSLLRFKPVKVSPKVLSLLVLKSLLNILQFIMFYIGLQRLDGSTASILIAITPLLIYFGAVRYLHEKARRRVLWGLLLALAGAITVGYNSRDSSGLTIDSIGLAAIGVSVVLDAASTLISKNLVHKMNPKAVMKSNFALMTLGFWIITALRNEWPNEISSTNWWLIALSGAGLALAFALYYFSLKRVKAEDVGMISYVTPLVAVLSAVIFLGEQPNTGFWVGASLIICGILLAELNTHIKVHRQRHFNALRHHQ